MINITVTHEPKPARARAWLAAALVLAVSAGCGGGGGGGSHAASPVRVDTVNPHLGAFIGGTHVTIRGVNFVTDSVNAVHFGGNPATNVIAVDEQTLTCDTPPGTPGATVDVVVQNNRGSGRLNGGFTYTSPAGPTTDLNGDGVADLVVAAPFDAAGGNGAGAVYVFFGSRSNSSLFDRTAAQADVRIVGHHSGDDFGASVCTGDVNGDGIDDLVVGADLVHGATLADTGACYVFFGPLGANSNMIALAADIRLSGAATTTGDRFGGSVLLADMDGDSRPDILVGAPLHDSTSAVDTGCIYVFRGGPTLVSKAAEQADFTFDGSLSNERLGSSVSCGDVDGDGVADLVIGSPTADVMTNVLLYQAGRAYVMRGGTQLSSRSVSQADAVFTGAAAGDLFGTSAAIADVTGDGIADLVVGAPMSDASDVDVGRVYVFHGSAAFAGASATAADATITGLATHNSFGTSVRCADINGDAIADILIGAPHADAYNDGNGRAYVFLGGNFPPQQLAIDATAMFDGESQEGEQFGAAVALIDYNGDGLADVIAAAPFHASGSGRIYLWLGAGAMSGGHPAVGADVHFNGVQPGSLFGTKLAP